MHDKKVFDELEGFDEDFFMYGEDLDLAIALKNRAKCILLSRN